MLSFVTEAVPSIKGGRAKRGKGRNCRDYQSENEKGTLEDVIKGADVFIGVSAPNTVTKEMVRSMNQNRLSAMANPEPEIYPMWQKKRVQQL